MNSIIALVKEVPTIGWLLIITLGVFPNIAKIVKYTYAFILARKWPVAESDEVDFFGFRLIKKHLPKSKDSKANEPQKDNRKDEV